ncbi:MAG: hypothetical protein LUF92_15150 [Clostridiales bacterium]|nr:hypothetical protein [Clostridiales bacterium]
MLIVLAGVLVEWYFLGYKGNKKGFKKRRHEELTFRKSLDPRNWDDMLGE